MQKQQLILCLRCIIAIAGEAAHPAEVLIADTTLPIGSTYAPSKPLNRMESLLSTVQMPKDIFVATFAKGKASTINIDVLAVSFFALSDTVNSCQI